MANIELVDGYKTGTTVATHDDFGELKNGVWVPKSYTGSYGTNGFRLTFEDGIESLSVSGYSGNVNAFRDKSSSSATNHWKIN